MLYEKKDDMSITKLRAAQEACYSRLMRYVAVIALGALGLLEFFLRILTLTFIICTIIGAMIADEAEWIDKSFLTVELWQMAKGLCTSPPK